MLGDEVQFKPEPSGSMCYYEISPAFADTLPVPGTENKVRIEVLRDWIDFI